MTTSVFDPALVAKGQRAGVRTADEDVDVQYRPIVASTALSAFAIIVVKAVSAIVLAKAQGIPVSFGLWRGWLPVVSINAFGRDFAHVVTWSTVIAGGVAAGWCVVATIVRRHYLVRWPTGAFLAVPMGMLLVYFEWVRFGTSGALQTTTALRLLAALAVAALFFVTVGLSHPSDRDRRMVDALLEPDVDLDPQSATQTNHHLLQGEAQ